MKLVKILSSMFLLLFTLATAYAVSPKLPKTAVPIWVQESKQQPKTPDLEDISDGYYFERIEYQVHLATQTRFSRSVKVLTENAGAENAGQIHISFEPQYQTLILHELYLLRDGKRIDRLDVGKFELMPYETELSRSIYNGTYSAYLLLDDLRKDDKIVLSYSIKGFNPVFGGKFFETYTLQGYEPTGLLYLNYIVPNGRQLHFKSFKGAPPAKKQDLNHSTSYYWDIAGTGKVEYESDVPTWYTTKQRIECSEFEKWSDVGQWASEVNPIPVLRKSGKLQQFADQQWQKAKGDSMAYVKEIADFVQNEIRYMGIEVGEYSHRANNPEKVFAQRYGDCKDKSVLLAALLQYKGIASQLVLVNSYEEYKLDEYLPSPTAFNHMVMHFSINGRGQYIDPTITNQGGPFRDRYFPFYGKVLWATPDSEMSDTEKYVSGKTRVEERFHLQKDGSAVLEVLTIYTGSNADDIRSYFKQTAKNQIEKSYLEYYKKIYKQTKKQAPLTYEDDFKTNVFRIKESYAIKKVSELDGTTNRHAISVYGSNISSSLPEILETRTAPIALSYPLIMEHEIYIINPDGVNTPTTKENTFVNRDSYYFGKEITNSQDTLKIAFRLGLQDTYVDSTGVQNYVTDFADKDSFFSAAIYLDDDGFVTGSNTLKEINWWSVLAFFGLLAIFAWVTRRYYNERKASSLIPLYEEKQHENIGGWLILLLLGLLLSPIRVLFSTMIPVYFNQNVWASLSYQMGNAQMTYASLMLLEFVGNTMLIFLSGYCFYLLIKKRDIFPQTFLATMLYQLLFILYQFVATYLLFGNFSELDYGPSEIIRIVLVSLVWALYVFKSTRVKGTFVVKSKTVAARESLATPPPPLPTEIHLSSEKGSDEEEMSTRI